MKVCKEIFPGWIFELGFLEFKDAFELFDRTGEGVIAWNECSSLARCFGFNPTDTKVKILLVGSEEEEDLPSAADMASKSISFDDFLPILWGIATSKDPGSYEDFFEGLKVSVYFIRRSKDKKSVALKVSS